MSHPVIEAAASGTLPAWAEASASRRDHMARVADLMAAWAPSLEPDPERVTAWRAAGQLHDVLRDAAPGRLRPLVPPPLRDLPDGLLHGPGAAARLRHEGVDDGAVLRAVEWHSLGHPDFGPLGKALYLADYLEPGRQAESSDRARLRQRVPTDLDGVVRDVMRARMVWSIEAGRPLCRQTVDLWNRLVHG